MRLAMIPITTNSLVVVIQILAVAQSPEKIGKFLRYTKSMPENFRLT